MPPNSKEYEKTYYKRKRREVLEELGNKCEICGTIFDLEIDHVNGYSGAFSPNGSRGGRRNLLDAIKLIKAGRKNELRLLCNECNANERIRTEDNKKFLKTSEYHNGLKQHETDLWIANLLNSLLFFNMRQKESVRGGNGK